MRYSPILRVALVPICFSSCAPENAPVDDAPRSECGAPRVVSRLPLELHEASGLAASQRDPAIAWLVNDDGPPQLFAIDSTSTIRARIPVRNAANRDWESLASAECNGRSCLYIGDVGDNLREQRTIAIYRLDEPALDATESMAVRFEMKFPDGAHDAEAIFVLPDERLFVLTKGRSEPLTLYRYPGPLDSTRTTTLELVQKLSPSFVQLPEMITGADASPDGSVIAIRTYSHVQLYRFDGQFLQPLLTAPGIGLAPLREFQGEGLGLRADGTILLVSERGLDQTLPPFSVATCQLQHTEQ